MREVTLKIEYSKRLAALYEALENDYQKTAEPIGLDCRACSDNCCDSYFLHHTYSEWAYLWEGICSMESDLVERMMERARDYSAKSRELIKQEERPQLMCPCNEDGLCMIYSHRLLVCRMHGVPASVTRPDGRSLQFPGCWKCQEIVSGKYSEQEQVPTMDRTKLFQEMARLESDLLGNKRHLYPRLKLTIADMLVDGPPQVNKKFCER